MLLRPVCGFSNTIKLTNNLLRPDMKHKKIWLLSISGVQVSCTRHKCALLTSNHCSVQTNTHVFLFPRKGTVNQTKEKLLIKDSFEGAWVSVCASAHAFASMRHASVRSLKGISGNGRGERRQCGGRFSRISNSSARKGKASSPRSAAPAATSLAPKRLKHPLPCPAGEFAWQHRHVRFYS